jgi:uncharacterized protein (DUF952 family)
MRRWKNPRDAVRVDVMLYHIVPATEFRAQIEGATYRPANLAHDGFVHCALRASVLPVANDYYSRVSGKLLLLEIDPERLASEIRYEAPAPIAGGGASHLASASEFPHVYGQIETKAITRVGLLVAAASGFRWPIAFMDLEAFLSHTEATQQNR